MFRVWAIYFRRWCTFYFKIFNVIKMYMMSLKNGRQAHLIYFARIYVKFTEKRLRKEEKSQRSNCFSNLFNEQTLVSVYHPNILYSELNINLNFHSWSYEHLNPFAYYNQNISSTSYANVSHWVLGGYPKSAYSHYILHRYEHHPA